MIDILILSKVERFVYELLVKNYPLFVSTEDIGICLGNAAMPSTRGNVWVVINRLRRKLPKNTVQSARGRGYRLTTVFGNKPPAPIMSENEIKLRNMLLDLEWAGWNKEYYILYCPSCQSRKPRHFKDCELRKVLDETMPLQGKKAVLVYPGDEPLELKEIEEEE